VQNLKTFELSKCSNHPLKKTIKSLTKGVSAVRRVIILCLIGLSLLLLISSDINATDAESIHVSTGSIITPKAERVYYTQLLDYIGKRLGRQIILLSDSTYAKTNNGLESGKIDMAFVCGGPYVEGHDNFGLELLAAPQVAGKTEYHSYIIVHKNSPVKNLKGLKGKSFAFTDPLSNTGKLVPTYMLLNMGETPNSFFKRYIFTLAHDRSIEAVTKGVVDGAAVDSLIYDFLAVTKPALISQTKIIEKSPPFGIPPIVVRHGIDQKLKKNLKAILLDAHKDVGGAKILKGMMIEKFVSINDSAYSSIREMLRAVAESEKKAGKTK
jgi:phosphonate transport system substrate-binding protein